MGRRSQSFKVIAALKAGGAAVRRRELVAIYGQRAFDGACRSNKITPLLADVYVHRENASDLATRIAASTVHFRGRGALSGVAACVLMGLTPNRPYRVTVVVPSKRRCDAPGWLRIRRLVHPLPTVRWDGHLVIPLAHALIQAHWDEGFDVARGLILEAIRRRRVTGPELLRALGDYPRISRRRILREFLSLLRDGVHSYLEYLGDTMVLNVPDLRHLELQKEFRVRGKSFFVDAYDDETKTAFEFDGAAYHSDDAARRRDLERDAALATIGVQTIRFTYEDVTERPLWCRTTIRDILAARRGSLAAG